MKKSTPNFSGAGLDRIGSIDVHSSPPKNDPIPPTGVFPS